MTIFEKFLAYVAVVVGFTYWSSMSPGALCFSTYMLMIVALVLAPRKEKTSSEHQRSKAR